MNMQLFRENANCGDNKEQWDQQWKSITDQLIEASKFDEIYWEFNKEILPNCKYKVVQQDNVFFSLLAWGNIYFIIMTIRRMIKLNKKGVSLIGLLEDISSYTSTETKAIIEDDIKALKGSTLKCVAYADKYLAHTDFDPPDELVFAEVRKALDEVWKFFQKYYCLYSGSHVSQKGVFQYNWKKIFKYPWIS